MRLEQFLRQFLEYIEVERGRSRRTIENYQFYLGRFLAWADGRGVKNAGAITQEVVRQYRLWLNRFKDRAGGELKRNTQNYHLIALRAFLKYLAKRDIQTLAPEKIELGKQAARQVDFLESDDLERMLVAPLITSSPSPHPPLSLRERALGEGKGVGLGEGGRRPGEGPNIVKLRDKAILEMLFSTGLRVSELAALKRTEINPKKEEFTVRGKGSKLRVVFMSPSARQWLKKYLEVRKDISPYLFVRHDRAAGAKPPLTPTPLPQGEGRVRAKGEKEGVSALTPRSIQRMVERYARAAGITKRITPHTLRHTFATDLLRNGADIRSVQALLGHSSITTTQVYTHVTDTQLREVHQAFHSKRRQE